MNDRALRRAALTAVAALVPTIASTQDFFAPPQTSGSLTVTLHPTEVVGAGQSDAGDLRRALPAGLHHRHRRCPPCAC